MRSSLAKIQCRSSLNEQEVFKEYALAYEEKLALVIPFTELVKLNNKEYEVCIGIGNKIYGGKK